MTYKEFLDFNEKTKKNHGLKVHIESVYFPHNAMVLKIDNKTEPIQIDNFLYDLKGGVWYTTNPSALKEWKGFDENNTTLQNKIVNKAVESINNEQDKFLEFISGQNCVMVRSIADFNKFVAWLKYHKVDDIIGRKPESKTFDYWLKLAVINRKNPQVFLFEYTYGKGFTWSDDIKAATEWNGKEPIRL